MIPSTPRNAYSADIRLELRINGHSLRLAQIGPEFVILREPADLPPCEAEVVMLVDGKERRWAVELPEGASRTDDLVKTVAREAVASQLAG